MGGKKGSGEKVEKARGGLTARERDGKGQKLLLSVCGDGVREGTADPYEPEIAPGIL